MDITIICAIARNHAIGLRGDLLYHISADLRRFKALTTGHTIIMGRRTFESLPKGALPHRRNIVLSRQSGYEAPGAEVFANLAAALAACRPDEHVFVIGGASVYAEALPLASCLELTHIDDTPREADVYFPETDLGDWQLEHEERFPADEKTPHSYRFATYRRRS